MKRTLVHVGLVTLAAAGLLSSARAIETGSRVEYPAFRIITERNIFNANRSSRSGQMPSREPDRRVRTETFTLLGTMSYEKGRFAFFDGSASEFRKVLQPRENIAGFRIVEVAPTCVKLEGTNGQTLELCVGMQMKKRDEEEWQLAGRVESSDVSPAASSSSNGSLGSAGGDPEVLKRLMEQRVNEDGVAAESPKPPPAPEGKTVEEPRDAGSTNEADDVLKRLLQKREQELNK